MPEQETTPVVRCEAPQHARVRHFVGAACVRPVDVGFTATLEHLGRAAEAHTQVAAHNAQLVLAVLRAVTEYQADIAAAARYDHDDAPTTLAGRTHRLDDTTRQLRNRLADAVDEHERAAAEPWSVIGHRFGGV